MGKATLSFLDVGGPSSYSVFKAQSLGSKWPLWVMINHGQKPMEGPGNNEILFPLFILALRSNVRIKLTER